MNKKFLSTLLAVVASSLTLNAAPVSKTRAKVVEVDIAPAKSFDIKLSPLKAIFEGTFNAGVEVGYDNFAGGISASWLFSEKHSHTLQHKIEIPNALKISMDFFYYENENRRSGLYYFTGAALTIRKAVDQNTETVKIDPKGTISQDLKNLGNDAADALKQADYYLSLHAGMGHKLELSNYIALSNSIEFEKVCYSKNSSKNINSKKVYPLLGNFRVNLIELRLTF